MSQTLLKALVVSIPVTILLAWSMASFRRAKTLGAVLQLVGSICLGLVILAHVCEALHRFRFMHWGESNSVGHYFDLVSAILGMTLVPIGIIVRLFMRPAPRRD